MSDNDEKSKTEKSIEIITQQEIDSLEKSLELIESRLENPIQNQNNNQVPVPVTIELSLPKSSSPKIFKNKHIKLIEEERCVTVNLETHASDSDIAQMGLPPYSNTAPSPIKHNYKRIKIYFHKRRSTLLKALPMILGTIFYIISLWSCYDQFYVCLKKYPPKAMLYGLLVVALSALCFTIQIFLTFFRKVCYKYLIINILVIMFLCYVYDTGSDLIHHGAYNRILLFISMFLWSLCITLGYVLYKAFRKFPSTVVFGVFCLFIIIYIHLHTVFKTSCKDWSKGFKNTHILNTNAMCQIQPPNVCYYRILDGYFDISSYLKISCKTDQNNNRLENVIPYIKDHKAKIIGYPITTNFDFYKQGRHDVIQKNVLERVVNMEDPNVDKSKVELTINYKNTPPSVQINITPNQDLIKEREKLWNQNINKPMAKNILYLFFDSVSRANFSKKLPKFWNWIESKYTGDIFPTVRTDYKYKHEAFQFFKYHGVGRYTRVNMVPTFFGIYNTDKEKEAEYFLKYFKEKGFITGGSLDYCSKEFFEIEDQEMNNLKWSPYDHEFISLYCDPNYSPYDEPFSMSSGSNSIKKKCLYNKYAVQHELDYLNEFWTKYSDQNKFFKMGIIDAHEGTYEAIKYDDHILYEYFTDFEKKGLLKDTIMIIQTDHGNTQPGPFSILHLQDFFKELSLPTLFVLMPTDMKDYQTLRRNILSNEQKFITPFTVHNSLIKILNDHKIPLSDHDKFSIFDGNIPLNRTCNDFTIEYALCRCKGQEDIQ
jgi:hypothetical protein